MAAFIVACVPLACAEAQKHKKQVRYISVFGYWKTIVRESFKAVKSVPFELLSIVRAMQECRGMLSMLGVECRRVVGALVLATS